MSTRALVIAAVLGLPATVYADTDDELRSFASSKYTYCDAKLLAALWKQSVADSKATIGRKVTTSSSPVIDRALGDARKKRLARCDYDEGGFSYDDAEKLAKLWKKSVADAKVMIGQKLTTVGAEPIRELLKRAAPAAGGDDVSEFLKQDKYTYCDAKLIAALWKQSVGEAKSYIGAKLRSSATVLLDKTLTQARANAKTHPASRCTFADGFSYQDASNLAKLWSITVSDAKARVEAKLLVDGGEQFVREQLKTGGADESDLAVFLKQSRYTYCDAKLIAAHWKQSIERSKAFIGGKVASKNTVAVDNTIVGARAAAKGNPAARCSFAEAGFSDDDAGKLAKLWNVSVKQAKVRAEDKILAGGEARVRKLLK